MYKRTKTSLRHVNGHWVGIFHEPTFRFDLHVLWNVTHEQLNKYCIKKWDTEIACSSGCAGTVTFLGQSPRSMVITFEDFNWSADSCDSLAHECFHVAYEVLKVNGLKLSDDSEEAYAYLIGSLVSRSLELINKTRGKKRVA